MKRISSTGLVCLALLMLVVAFSFCGTAHAAASASSTSQTLFTTQTPALPNVQVGPFELGTEFTSSVAGQITAIRFWKSSSETGQHIGHIWSASGQLLDRKSTRLNSSHQIISYAVFCLKKKKIHQELLAAWTDT